MIDWSLIGPALATAIQDTLWMVLVTIALSGVFGLAFGTLLYATRPGNLLQNKLLFAVLNVVVNIVRPIPFIIFIAAMQPATLAIAGTTIGSAAAIVPMTIMASVVIGRIVEQNLVPVDPGVVEAARAMGASRIRILLTIVLPEALGPLILGYTFVFIGVVDMSAMAGAVGGGGLGDFALTYGYQQFNYPLTLLAIVIIIVLVQLAQLLGNFLARRVMRR